jgi:hypothetical protein
MDRNGYNCVCDIETHSFNMFLSMSWKSNISVGARGNAGTYAHLEALSVATHHWTCQFVVMDW